MTEPTSEPGDVVKVTLTCGSRREWIDPVQELTETACGLAGLDEEQRYWPVMAIREAVMNAVLHGNQERAERVVRVELQVSSASIEARVFDQGSGFDPGDLSDPLSPDNLLSEGGRGVYLMRQFMDEVEFLFPDEGGTCIALLKRLDAPDD